MNEALMLAFAAAVPFLCLGLLLWLARLEDTLTDGLEPAPVPGAAETEPAAPTVPAGDGPTRTAVAAA